MLFHWTGQQTVVTGNLTDRCAHNITDQFWNETPEIWTKQPWQARTDSVIHDIFRIWVNSIPFNFHFIVGISSKNCLASHSVYCLTLIHSSTHYTIHTHTQKYTLHNTHTHTHRSTHHTIHTHRSTHYTIHTHTHTEVHITQYTHTHRSTHYTIHTEVHITQYTHTEVHITQYTHTHTQKYILHNTHTHTEVHITQYTHTHRSTHYTIHTHRSTHYTKYTHTHTHTHTEVHMT